MRRHNNHIVLKSNTFIKIGNFFHIFFFVACILDGRASANSDHNLYGPIFVFILFWICWLHLMICWLAAFVCECVYAEQLNEMAIVCVLICSRPHLRGQSLSILCFSSPRRLIPHIPDSTFFFESVRQHAKFQWVGKKIIPKMIWTANTIQPRELISKWI